MAIQACRLYDLSVTESIVTRQLHRVTCGEDANQMKAMLGVEVNFSNRLAWERARVQ
jgi:hypothetical protein